MPNDRTCQAAVRTQVAAALETALAQDLLRVRPTLLLLLPAGATEPGHVTKGRVQDGQVCGSLLAADGGQAAGPARRRGAAGGLWGTRHKAWAQLHLAGAGKLRGSAALCCAQCVRGSGPRRSPRPSTARPCSWPPAPAPHGVKVRRGASAGPQLTGDRDPHDPGPGLGQPESG